MATIKNMTDQPQTISWQIPRTDQYIHITIKPGQTNNEIPDDVAVRAISSKEQRWMNVWGPGDMATAATVKKTQPQVIMRQGSKKGDDNGGK